MINQTNKQENKLFLKELLIISNNIQQIIEQTNNCILMKYYIKNKTIIIK